VNAHVPGAATEILPADDGCLPADEIVRSVRCGKRAEISCTITSHLSFYLPSSTTKGDPSAVAVTTTKPSPSSSASVHVSCESLASTAHAFCCVLLVGYLVLRAPCVHCTRGSRAALVHTLCCVLGFSHDRSIYRQPPLHRRYHHHTPLSSSNPA
jgi:hypothetical protein